MIAQRVWITGPIVFLLMFIILKGNLHAESLDIEAGLSSYSYSGEVHESTQYSMVRIITLQQNFILNYSSSKTGYLLTGIEFADYSMVNAHASMYFLRAGFVGTYHFDKVFRSARYLYPLIRVHSGICRFEIVDGPDDLERRSDTTPYAGLGFGLGYSLYQKLHMKTLYMFDTHFFEEGEIFAHSLYISLSYLVDF